MVYKITTLLAIIVLVSSCTKSGSIGSSTAGVNIKYEITTTSVFLTTGNTYLGGNYVISYTNGTGLKSDTVNVNLQGKNSWSSSVVLTEKTRPLTLTFNMPDWLYFSGNGTVTYTIYVNGKPVSTETKQIGGTSTDHFFHWGEKRYTLTQDTY